MQVVQVQRIQGWAGQAEVLHVKVHTCEGVAEARVARVASAAVAIGREARCFRPDSTVGRSHGRWRGRVARMKGKGRSETATTGE